MLLKDLLMYPEARDAFFCQVVPRAQIMSTIKKKNQPQNIKSDNSIFAFCGQILHCLPHTNPEALRVGQTSGFPSTSESVQLQAKAVFAIGTTM